MRVSVIINRKAGSIKVDSLIQKIEESLFRCDVQIFQSSSFQEMDSFILAELKNKTDAFMICGGDGTINATLQVLMKYQEADTQLPPISIVSSGTANDLAHEIGISRRIGEATRLILEGTEKKIDIIEVSSGGQTKYMLTNGGLGIPAATADQSNKLRSFLQNLASAPEQNHFSQLASQYTYQMVKSLGSTIYSMTLLKTLTEWKQQGWDLEITFSDGKVISTFAPIVLVNNQPFLARKFLTGPYTSNSDGSVNLIVMETLTIMSQLKEIIKVLRGLLKENDLVQFYEVPGFSIRSKNPDRKLTFFGDGEILFENVDQVNIKCLPQKLTVMVKE